MKLKVITLTKTDFPDFMYTYSAVDSDGKVLASRVESIAANNQPYIAAFITKNKNYIHSHSMLNLFTAFNRIANRDRTRDNPKKRPYAIAVAEEHKQAYTEWLEANGGELPIKYPKWTLEDRLSE